MTTTEKQTSVSMSLRRLADWLDKHPGAEEQIMYARASRADKYPQLKFHSVEVLRAAFPGKQCIKRHHERSEVHELDVDGIHFESWQSADPETPKEVEVTL